jgi:hypothetical protein
VKGVKMRNSIFLVLLSSALAVLSVVPGRAADLPATPTPDFVGETAAMPSGWTFNLAPYAWASGISGKVAAFGAPSVNVDLSFSDALHHLDGIPVMAVGEARNGRFGIFDDILYVKLGANATGPLGFATVSLTSSEFAGTAMGEYRIVENSTGSLDAMAGVRVWDVQTGLGFHTAFPGHPGGSFSDGATWVDPMIGAKGRIKVGGRFYLTDWAMIGGFGASSTIDWDVMGGVGYDFNKTFSMVAGYRALGVNYSKGGFVFDVVQQGPFAGMVFHF